MPVWPGSPGVRVKRFKDIARGDDVIATDLALDVHCGTHVDAPRHVFADGQSLEDLPLDTLVGPAYVADVGDAVDLDGDLLEHLEVPVDVERLLLKTASSGGWTARPFTDEYPALTLDGARWCAARGLRLIGIDYLSIQRFHDPLDTHRVLLETGAAILEGLDLNAAEPGWYQLVCLPVRVEGAEAAPARAVLLPAAS